MLDWKMRKVLKNKLNFVHSEENLRKEKFFLKQFRSQKQLFMRMRQKDFCQGQSFYISKATISINAGG